MNANEARKIVIDLSKNFDKLDYIYGKINNAIINGWGNVYIDKFNITINEKEKLESDGYFVDTSVTQGFCIRWYETDKDYFMSMLEQIKQHGYIKVNDEIIIKYLKLQEF
jgi:hypothetical protein